MKCVIDIETNGLKGYDRIWVVCGIDVDTGKEYIFREPYKDNYTELTAWLSSITCAIGHNFLGFDLDVLNNLLPANPLKSDRVIDTLVVSRLTNFNREGGHSLKAWGKRVGIQKPDHDDWYNFSEAMVNRCLEDARINLKVYLELLKFITSPLWADALRLEHDIQVVCQQISSNGFYFNNTKALELLKDINLRLSTLDINLKNSFRPKSYCLREVTPKFTQHGTLHKGSFKFLKDNIQDLVDYNGYPFSVVGWEEFNPNSPKQIVERLNEAGWKPTEKTKGHEEFLREIRGKKHTPEIQAKKAHYQTYGWGITENNLLTLPETAPEASRKLAERLILAGRTRKLEECFKGFSEATNRIHGQFSGIGAKTHRMAHADPNMANLPTEKPQDPDWVLAINRTIRECFTVPEGSLLVGVDADQIQLRILAHHMEDQRFIDALVNGDKAKGTDVHSLNVTAIGPACQGRRDAKTFIYAWLLGAGVGRIQEILDCSRAEAQDASDRFLTYYPGLERLKKEVIPKDVINGYIKCLDNRFIPCDTEHRALGIYLQSGEAIVMKRATRIWMAELNRLGLPYKLVNFVHDEWQTEVPDDPEIALQVARCQADAIARAGEELGLLCPTKGSIYGGHDQLAIGKTWFETH